MLQNSLPKSGIYSEATLKHYYYLFGGFTKIGCLIRYYGNLALYDDSSPSCALSYLILEVLIYRTGWYYSFIILFIVVIYRFEISYCTSYGIVPPLYTYVQSISACFL